MGGNAVIIRAGLVAFAVFCVLPLGTLAQNTPRTPSRASADDCAVIAEVGEGKLSWREKSPDMPMSPRSYSVDCDWKALGIKDFVISPPDSGLYYQGVRFLFSRPIYSPDGLNATVTYTFGGNSGPRSYFFQLSYCSAEKVDGWWQFSVCKPGPIT
jgi:hypothetical protein